MRGVILIAALAFAVPSSAGSTFEAHLKLEGGASFETNPLIIPSRGGICHIERFFRSGTLVYGPGDRSSNEYGPDGCRVLIRMKGYAPIETILTDGVTIVLRRESGSLGSTVSKSTAEAPAAARDAYSRGVAAMVKKKWATSETEMRKAVGIYPKYAPARGDLGTSLVAQGRNEEAIAAFHRAIDSDSRFVEAYIELAKLDLDAGRNREALELCNMAKNLDPAEFPMVFFYAASAEFLLGDLKGAKADCKREVQLDDNRSVPRTRYLMAQILSAEGDTPGAIAEYREYLREYGEAPDRNAVKQEIARLRAR